MRSIIFLSVMNGAGWGGSEEQWYQLALYYAEKKIKTAAVFFDWPEKAGRIKALRDAGCQVYGLLGMGRRMCVSHRLYYRVMRRY